MKFSRSDFEMQGFESRRPRLRVLANFDFGMQRFDSKMRRFVRGQIQYMCSNTPGALPVAGSLEHHARVIRADT